MTQFIQLSAAGLALGCVYGLLALGFVIVLRSSHVFNLMQGGFVLLAAYLTYNARVTWGLPFGAAALFAIIVLAVVGPLVEASTVRHVKAGGLFAPDLVTLGLLFVVEAVVAATWGYYPLNMDDPFGLNRFAVGGVAITFRDAAVILGTVLILGGLFALFQRSDLGVGMRASASDSEAAQAQGIDPRIVRATAWAIAGAVGAVAGIFLGTAIGGGLRLGISHVALAALPAIVVGGVTSPVGAVAGGIIIGVSQTYAAAYAPAWTGGGFHEVMPYIVMVIVLLIRPYGLFGQAAAERA